MKVLIIDDSHLIIDRIKKIISSIGGFTVVGETGSIIVAEQIIEEKKPDIIILDIHLYDGSGLALLYSIHSKKTDIKTIILTNYSSPILVEKSFELGAKYFLEKSESFNELKDKLKLIACDIK